MKIQGTFMASRAGRRIFWTLLLAAAAPIATFGVAMHAMLSAQFESQAFRQQVQLTKMAGMSLLDRLLVARTTLDIVARTGGVDADFKAEGRNGRVLLEVAQLDAGQDLVEYRSRAALARSVSAWQSSRAGHRDTGIWCRTAPFRARRS
jgi:hypothetical protein